MGAHAEEATELVPLPSEAEDTEKEDSEKKESSSSEKAESRRTGIRIPEWCRISIKGEVNACVCFAIFITQVYTTAVSIFGKSLLDPFKEESFDNATLAESTVGDSTTTVFSLLVIWIFCIVGGYIMQLCRLPGLLGMLIMGILLRNVPFFSILMVEKSWSVVLRRTAFVVILLRGGSSLDAEALKKLKGACLRLALLPCTVEAVAVSLAAKIIFDMNIMFGLILGFVLAAVSPAVVVPSMLDAAEKGYGISAGIPTLVIAAASLDDVYAITLFSLFITIVFSTGSSIVLTLLQAPVEIIAGILFGIGIGVIISVFPSSDLSNLHLIRLSMLAAFSTSLMFGTTALGVDAIGAIAILVAAFVAAMFWKKEGEMPEEAHLAVMWNLFFQPFLFGLIGFELSFAMISVKSVLLGLLVLIIGLTFRTAAAMCAVSYTGLNLKERLFVALAWIPKATVQAALAPVALDMARSRTDLPSSYVDNGIFIFTVAVLSILTTAPIGAFVIRLTTPRLLKKEDPVKLDINIE